MHVNLGCIFGITQSSCTAVICHAGFANEGQFLLMNSASLSDMNLRIDAQASRKRSANIRRQMAWKGMGEVSRFRPNLLVGGPGIEPYAEDAWQELQIGTNCFFTAGTDTSTYCTVQSLVLQQ